LQPVTQCTLDLTVTRHIQTHRQITADFVYCLPLQCKSTVKAACDPSGLSLGTKAQYLF